MGREILIFVMKQLHDYSFENCFTDVFLQVSARLNYSGCIPWSGIRSPLQRVVWFRLVSLFNGISTFVGYLMPKPFS